MTSRAKSRQKSRRGLVLTTLCHSCHKPARMVASRSRCRTTMWKPITDVCCGSLASIRSGPLKGRLAPDSGRAVWAVIRALRARSGRPVRLSTAGLSLDPGPGTLACGASWADGCHVQSGCDHSGICIRRIASVSLLIIAGRKTFMRSKAPIENPGATSSKRSDTARASSRFPR